MAGRSAGEGGDAPLVGVRGVLGEPGLVGPGEVPDPEVDDPDGGRLAAVGASGKAPGGG